MHELEVLLVVTSPDMARPGNSKFLLIRRPDGAYQLPVAPLGRDQSTLEVAARLLHRLTGLKARILGVGYVDLVPMPLVDSVDRKKLIQDSYDGEDRSFEQRWIGVPYGAMLPGEVVKLSDPKAVWVPLVEAFQAEFYLDHKQVLKDVCHRI